MNLLLISNSTNAGEEYLKYPIKNIESHLKGVKKILFVPYAAVTFSFDEYREKVAARFAEINIEVESIYQAADPIKAIGDAEAICMGGGNTFALLKTMQQNGLIAAIAERVREGVPYVGWSAGSNVTSPTICTTNDMPIVEPRSFQAMNLVPFQINPHYLDANPEGHAGETREQRIEEYITANPEMYVVGLREGCMLELRGNELKLIGERPMRIFKYDEPAREVHSGDSLSFLL